MTQQFNIFVLIAFALVAISCAKPVDTEGGEVTAPEASPVAYAKHAPPCDNLKMKLSVGEVEFGGCPNKCAHLGEQYTSGYCINKLCVCT